MTAQSIRSNMVLFIPQEELAQRSLQGEELTHAQAMSLLASVFETAGKPLPAHADLQVFSAKSGVLLFLRPLHTAAMQLGISAFLLS